jgi:hypothetical protein
MVSSIVGLILWGDCYYEGIILAHRVTSLSVQLSVLLENAFRLGESPRVLLKWVILQISHEFTHMRR